jgi:hypothetical protein
MRSITLRVTEGERSKSPAAIVWMASISSSGFVRLSRKPEAPALRASKMWSSCSKGGQDREPDGLRRVVPTTGRGRIVGPTSARQIPIRLSQHNRLAARSGAAIGSAA